MEFNDGSQFHPVVDPNAYMAYREMYEFRACSAKTTAGFFGMYVDTAFEAHRAQLSAMMGLLLYQFVYPDFTPEAQADFFCSTIGTLRDNEMVMCDIEASGTGFVAANVADFVTRWCARVEATLGTLAWVYVPSAFSGQLNRRVTGNRIVKAPRYNADNGLQGALPNWDYDVWQYSTKGAFPGSGGDTPGKGDINTTDWTLPQLLARCSGAPSPIRTARRPLTRPLAGI